MVLIIFIFVVFIILSAFFSASETAIFSLSDLKLRRMSERYARAKVVKNLLKRPTRLLSAIVFGNLLVNIGFSSLSTAIFVKIWGNNGLVFAIFLSGIIILFLGEVFPKTFAIYMAERVSLLFSPVLDTFSRLFSPFIIFIEKIVQYFSSFIIKKHKKSPFSDGEVKAAIVLSKKDGQISAQEEDIISHVLEFKDTKASEILTARIDINGIDSSLNQNEVMSILRRQKHSKFPVYENSLDNVIGILYAKDIFLNFQEDYHKFLRKPIFVPESKGIDDILKLFLDDNERIAIVLDEYGGTEGLITLEDVIEEIFGEIYDEFEKIQEPLEKIEDKKWRVYGKAPIKTVNLELDLDLPEAEDTIAGFILSQMEKIPKVNESLSFRNIDFIIERATARRIISVILKIKD